MTCNHSVIKFNRCEYYLKISSQEALFSTKAHHTEPLIIVFPRAAAPLISVPTEILILDWIY